MQDRVERASDPEAAPTAGHELDAPPWLRVETTLMALARLVREAYDARLTALGLNLTQASTVAYLAEFGPAIQTRIADHLRHGRAATGASIDRLQTLGLVERQPDPDDRRVWRIGLTESGRQTATQIAAIDQILRVELRHGISRDERRALTDLLTRLQGNLVAAIDRTPVTAVPPTPTQPDPPTPTQTVPPTPTQPDPPTPTLQGAPHD